MRVRDGRADEQDLGEEAAGAQLCRIEADEDGDSDQADEDADDLGEREPFVGQQQSRER